VFLCLQYSFLNYFVQSLCCSLTEQTFVNCELSTRYDRQQPVYCTVCTGNSVFKLGISEYTAICPSQLSAFFSLPVISPTAVFPPAAAIPLQHIPIAAIPLFPPFSIRFLSTLLPFFQICTAEIPMSNVRVFLLRLPSLFPKHRWAVSDTPLSATFLQPPTFLLHFYKPRFLF
jgi:hypothetical protein